MMNDPNIAPSTGPGRDPGTPLGTNGATWPYSVAQGPDPQVGASTMGYTDTPTPAVKLMADNTAPEGDALLGPSIDAGHAYDQSYVHPTYSSIPSMKDQGQPDDQQQTFVVERPRFRQIAVNLPTPNQEQQVAYSSAYPAASGRQPSTDPGVKEDQEL